MPLFNLRCSTCGDTKRLLVAVKSFDDISKDLLFCCKCKVEMARCGKGPSTSVKEVLDNGAMPRAVERFHDIEDTMRERHLNADPLAGKRNFS